MAQDDTFRIVGASPSRPLRCLPLVLLVAMCVGMHLNSIGTKLSGLAGLIGVCVAHFRPSRLELPMRWVELKHVRTQLACWLVANRNWLRCKSAWSARKCKHIIEYVLFRLMVAVVQALPLNAATAVVAKISRFLGKRSRRHNRALANLARAFPEKSVAEREAIALAMWENLGRVAAEACHTDRFIREPHRIDGGCMRILDEYVSRKGLYIAATLHTGNWELGLLHAARLGFRPAALYRIVANPYVDRAIRASRAKIYQGGMFPVSVESTSRQLVQCLRKGVPLGIVADHFDPKGVPVQFFGQTIYASRVPATFAVQFDARICVARTIRLGTTSRFTVEAKELEVPKSGNRHDDIMSLTVAIQQHFESWIREYPEQWMWYQAPLVRTRDVSDALN